MLYVMVFAKLRKFNLKSVPCITKDPEGIMGLDFQSCWIAEGTQEVQEILKAQAPILHVRRREDVTYPFPEGVGLKDGNTELTIITQHLYSRIGESWRIIISLWFLHCDQSTDFISYLQFRKRKDLLHGHPGAVRPIFSALEFRKSFVCPKQTWWAFINIKIMTFKHF